MGKSDEILLNHEVEFDVIIDGKRVERVRQGILWGKKGDTLIGFFGGGSRYIVCEVAYAMSEFIVNNNLQKEFDEFVKSQK